MSDHGTDEQDLLPGSELERTEEEAHGLAAIPAAEVPLLPGELRPHPEPFQYVMIAVVLCVITALEVGMYYIEGDIPDALYVGVLLAMALAKFITVASWYMHLRTDRPIFRRFFTLGATAAVVLYAIVLSTLHIWQ
jgi:caa(3)-type oxidase subunit IV